MTSPPLQNPDSQLVWIALRTCFSQEIKVGGYLDSRHIPYFIPMVLSADVDKDGKPVRRHRPAVHNLLFIPLEQNHKTIREILRECPYAIHVYGHPDRPGEWYKIPDRDMQDLRLICDLTYTEPQFVSAQECELKVGHTVRVTHGPLKNITGKLVRKSKKYYLVRTFGDLGVMISVSRWCCEAI